MWEHPQDVMSSMRDWVGASPTPQKNPSGFCMEGDTSAAVQPSDHQEKILNPEQPEGLGWL